MLLRMNHLLLCVATTLAACGSETATQIPQTCPPPPSNLPIPWHVATPGTAAVHWGRRAGCVPVTYDASLTSNAPALAAAIALVNGITCSHLCFAPPTLSETAPDPQRTSDRRVHLRASVNAQASESSIVYDSVSGRVRNAIFSVPDVSLRDDARGALARALLLSAGMRASPSTAPSMLAVNAGVRTATPSDADRAAFCAVYGTPPLCDD